MRRGDLYLTHTNPLTDLLRLVILVSILSLRANSSRRFAVMKLFSAATSLLFAASLIQTAVGLNCNSGCGACWKDDNANGADIKFTCTNGGNCGDKCPQGYHGIHCAEATRCWYVNYSKSGRASVKLSTRCDHKDWGWNCDDLGPCACSGGEHNCGGNECFQ